MAAQDRTLSSYGLVMPVYHVDVPGAVDAKIIGEVVGSCSSIAPNLFLTAGHVVSALNASKESAVIGFLNPASNRLVPMPIQASEQLAADIGILRAETALHGQWFGRPSWSREPLIMLSPVQAYGYPYGLREFSKGQMVVQRGFVGHIVAHISEYLPLGMKPPSFGVYELSFAVPRGLSGAPLLRQIGGTLDVHGIVIGNSDSSMLVYQGSESEGEGHATTVVERYESLSLGLAVDAVTIMGLHSRMLGSTVQQCIAANGILRGDPDSV
jgi:hypothetical protein